MSFLHFSDLKPSIYADHFPLKIVTIRTASNLIPMFSTT